jgi:hypothetical protein
MGSLQQQVGLGSLQIAYHKRIHGALGLPPQLALLTMYHVPQGNLALFMALTIENSNAIFLYPMKQTRGS